MATKKKTVLKKPAKKQKIKIKNVPVFDDKMVDHQPKPTKKAKEKKLIEEKDKRDKIFENNYNMGNFTTESLPEIRIEGEFASNLDDVYNADEYMERKKLMEEVFDAFKNSQWGTLPLTKKFSKELMPYIFNDIFKSLDNKNYSVIDMFICIAEFMDVSYERVYEIAGLRMKEKLIKELEEKYKILSKKHINRLF